MKVLTNFTSKHQRCHIHNNNYTANNQIRNTNFNRGYLTWKVPMIAVILMITFLPNLCMGSSSRRISSTTSSLSRSSNYRYNFPTELLLTERKRGRKYKIESIAILIRGGSSSPSPSPSPPKYPFGLRRVPKTNDGYFSSSITATASQQKQQDQEYLKTKEKIDEFLTRDSRNTFIARVYTILSGQLLTTAFACYAFGTNQWNIRDYVNYTPFGRKIPLAAAIISTAVYFILCASAVARRSSPLKWQLLTLFTLGESISVGFFSSFFDFKSVCTSMITTAVAAIVVSLYTILQKNQKYDLSQWGQTLSTWATIFIVYGLIHFLQIIGIIPQGFMPYNEMIFSFVGACLFSAFLAYHTKMIVSNKHTKYQMNQKDYIFASITLYMDIINMFIYILRIMGDDRD